MCVDISEYERESTVPCQCVCVNAHYTHRSGIYSNIRAHCASRSMCSEHTDDGDSENVKDRERKTSDFCVYTTQFDTCLICVLLFYFNSFVCLL